MVARREIVTKLEHNKRSGISVIARDLKMPPVCDGRWVGCLRGFALALTLVAWGGQVGAQIFSSQGPAPSIYPDPGLGFNGNWAGAIQSVLVNPSNPNAMLIGSVNGGVWQTLNGGATWVPLTDRAQSLSIGSLSYDPTDLTHQKIYAGVGITSNGAIGPVTSAQARGGARIGILYSSNGGASWSVMGGSTLAGMSVVDVQARDSTILAATFEPQQLNATVNYGLYRSIDSGANFFPVTSDDGLASGPVTSLIGVPDNAKQLYAFVANVGLFGSADSGLTWYGLRYFENEPYAHLATGPGGAIAVATFNSSGTMIGVQLSKDSGKTWAQLNVPQVNSGGQAAVNLAVAIDPNNTNIVYVAGDAVGANNDVSLAAYRVVFDPATGASTPYALSYVSTVTNNTAVHADARSFAFLPSGTMVLVQDAGIYLRPNPQGDAIWTALNTSTLSVRESYALAFDAVSKRLVVAAQDTGTARQVSPGSAAYTSVEDGGGDGFNAVINDRTLASQGISVLYETAQNLGLGNLMRWTYNKNGNTAVATAFPFGLGLTGPKYLPFLSSDYTEVQPSGPNALPMASKVILNRVDPTMLAFGTNYVYVAQDLNAQAQGLTGFTNVSTPDNQPILGGVTALVYGTRDNKYALLAGGTQSLYLSTTALANSLNPLPSYAALPNVGTPTGIVFDARTQNRFYVADMTNLWASNDRGLSFSSLTGNFSWMGVTRPTSVEFISSNGVDALLTGGVMFSDVAQSPIVVADSDANGNLSGWRYFGLGLPNAVVNVMTYNDTADVLAISSYGRGVWVLYDVTSYFPQASVLRFGLADNDSGPAASLLTGTRPLEKYGIGTLSINGIASYTGQTSVFGGTLALVGPGSIASSSGLFVDTPGFFDISASTSGASIRTLSGGGTIRLGSSAMTITNAVDTFSGSMTDGGISGGVGGSLIIAGGVQGLAGNNTYSGGTAVLGGTLALIGFGSIASSSGLFVDTPGSFDISRSNAGASIRTLAGSGTVRLGSNAMTITNASDTFSGSVTDGGITGGVGGSVIIAGGIERLAGLNTYSGSTQVLGGTLALVGAGSIAGSGRLFVDAPGSFDISGSASGASIRSLSGSGMIRLGSKAVTITNASDTFTGSMTNGGSAGGSGGSVIVAGGVQGLGGYSTYSGGTQVLGGTLSIGGIYPLGTGPVYVASGATLMGTGTILGATTVAGTLKPGNSPGFLATNATVTMTSGSRYLEDIAGAAQATSATPAASTGYYSSLQVTGGQFVIQPGSTLTVRLSNLFSPGEPGFGSVPYTPQLGDKFRIVSADGGIAGRFPAIAQPTGLSPGTQLMPYYNVGGNNSLDMFAIPQSYSVATAATANGNGRSVASGLDQLLRRNFAGTSTANQDQLLYAVAGQTASGLPSYVTSLAGELYGASLAVVPQATQRVQQSVLARLGDTYPGPSIATAGAALTNVPVNPLSMEIMNGKTPGGAAPFYVSSNPEVNPTAPVAASASLSSGAAWGEIAFQRGNRSGDDNASGFSSNLYQAVFGVDAYSEHGRKFGGGLAISTTSVWANGGTATVQQGALFLYGKLPLESWVVDGLASYGMNTTDNQRTSLSGLSDSLQAKGVRGNDALLSLGASRPIEFEDVRVTHYARVTWQQVSQSGFSEGSTPAALTVDRFNGNAVRGTLGLSVGSTSVNPMNDQYTYRGYVGVGADTPGLNSPMLNASLAGMPTTIATPSVGSTFVQAGLYATAKMGENAFGYLGVSGEVRSGQTLAGVALGVRIQY